jgi:hypothetical protein
LEQLANNASGTLSANITNIATSLTLNAGQGNAFPSSGNFRILIGSELILVGARSTDTLSSLTRGIEGTAAAAHNSGDAVSQIVTSAGLLQFIQDNSVQKPIGVVSGEAPIWNGTAWVRSSVTNLSVGSIAPGTNGQYLQTSGGVTAWGSPPSIAPTHLAGMVSGTGFSTLAANTAYLVPVANFTNPSSVSRIYFAVGGTSGNVDVGIYYSDDELTFAKLFTTGSFATPAANTLAEKSFTTQSLAPVLGRRWYYALAPDNATATFEVRNSGGTPQIGVPFFTKATSFPLPTSISSATKGGATCPVLHAAI